jgi:hypothetical protein
MAILGAVLENLTHLFVVCAKDTVLKPIKSEVRSRHSGAP